MPIPNCDIPQDLSVLDTNKGEYYKDVYNVPMDHDTLYNFITEYIGADCWCLTIGNEIIFNFYDKTFNVFKAFKD